MNRNQFLIGRTWLPNFSEHIGKLNAYVYNPNLHSNIIDSGNSGKNQKVKQVRAGSNSSLNLVKLVRNHGCACQWGTFERGPHGVHSFHYFAYLCAYVNTNYVIGDVIGNRMHVLSHILFLVYC